MIINNEQASKILKQKKDCQRNHNVRRIAKISFVRISIHQESTSEWDHFNTQIIYALPLPPFYWIHKILQLTRITLPMPMVNWNGRPRSRLASNFSPFDANVPLSNQKHHGSRVFFVNHYQCIVFNFVEKTNRKRHDWKMLSNQQNKIM